jgi:hypothetical protein
MGPLYYPAEELAHLPGVWNQKPVVVYHPIINGKGCSACDPDILTNRKVGVIMNAHWDDGKLKAEAWLEEDRCNAVDDRIMTFLNEGTMMEVSTGLFTTNTEEEGTWNEEDYVAVARDYRPDHLALLPDKKGACSIEDGAGLLRLNQEQRDALKDVAPTLVNEVFTLAANLVVMNALSHDNIRSAISNQLNSGDDFKFWVVDVYDTFFIYEKDGKLYKRGYTANDTKVDLETEETEVLRVTEYRTRDGAFVGNSKRLDAVEKGDSEMDRKEIIAALIANELTVFTENDQAALEALSDEDLQRYTDKATEVEDAQALAVANAAKTGAKDITPEPDAAPAARADTPPQTADEYVANAPDEIKDMLTNGLAAHKAERATLVATITANKANTFTADQLATKDMAELKGIAALAALKPANYSGQADPAVASNQDDEPLALPTMNFGPKTD